MPDTNAIVASNLRRLFDAAQRGVISGPTTFSEVARMASASGTPIARRTVRRAFVGGEGSVRVDVLARIAKVFNLAPWQLLTPKLKPTAATQGSTTMPPKRTPPPFAPLHRDYADSLEAVLLAAGLLAETVRTMLEVGEIPPHGAAALRLSQAVARYQRAWDGDSPPS